MGRRVPDESHTKLINFPHVRTPSQLRAVGVRSEHIQMPMLTCCMAAPTARPGPRKWECEEVQRPGPAKPTQGPLRAVPQRQLLAVRL